MPDRIIRESICTSETINLLTWFEEAFFYRLTVICDDYGRFDARPEILNGRLFPLNKSVTDKNVSDALNKLSSVGLVKTYVCEGKPYLQLVTWGKYQRTRANKSKFPDPPTSADIRRQLPSNAPESRESGIECDMRESGDTRANFAPPSLEEVTLYCKERKSKIDPQRFVNFYTAKGWMIGKNKMQDWKAAVHTWEQRDKAEKSDKKTESSLDIDEIEDLIRRGEFN